MSSAVEPLKYPQFRWLWAGNVFSASGTFVQSVAASWLMYELTGSGAWVGLIVASLSGNRDDRGGRGLEGGLHLGYVLFRVVAEALFWTFHPAWVFVPDAHPARASRFDKKQKKKSKEQIERVNDPELSDVATFKPGFEQDLRRIEERAYALAGGPFNLGSPKQIAELLFEKLIGSNGRRGGARRPAASGRRPPRVIAAAV